MFRVIVAGSRNFNNYELLRDKLDVILSRKENIVIVSGTAKGADQLGEQYARERGHRIARYTAEWEKYGKKAGPLRNAKMAENADALVAYWDGKSRGTKSMIEEAKKRGLLIRVIYYGQEAK